MARPILGSFKNRRGQTLGTVSFLPPSSDPIAHLWFHHGLAEHIRRYDKVFQQIAKAGIAVHAFDAHGHGQSEPRDKAQRALVNKFDDLVDDMYDVVDRVCKGAAQCDTPKPVPFFVGGHSMGGLVAAHAVLRSSSRPASMKSPWSGLILHSAAVDVEWTTVLRVQAKIGGLMSWLIPRARIVPAVKPEHMSTDPAVVDDYIKDPLNTVGNVCARTGNELLCAFRRLVNAQKDLTIPIYAAHGSGDRCTSAPAVKRLLQNCGSKDTTFHEFDGAYHELLHGPEREEATEALISWMMKRVAASTGARL